jgi:hypothetical protein
LQVEQHYMRKGFLLPSFHKAYWMGYTNPIRDGTTWVWTDSTLTALNGTGSGSGGTASASADGSTYKHWGTLVLTVNGVKSSYSEPNNRGGSEYCAVGDFTQAYGPGMLPAVAGWADASCTDQHIAMCKVTQAAWSLRVPMPCSHPALHKMASSYWMLGCLTACNCRAGAAQRHVYLHQLGLGQDVRAAEHPCCL